jgi:hypothetical protein
MNISSVTDLSEPLQPLDRLTGVDVISATTLQFWKDWSIRKQYRRRQ